MKIIGAAKELKPDGRKVCLAIGVFDGVHLGHQQILRQTITDARRQEGLALALTFDRHPSAVVAPGHEPSLIYTLSQKLRALASLGADAALVIPFDQEFSRQTGGEFIHRLARDLGQIHSICVGRDFVFGWQRSGHVDLLKTLGAELQFTVHGLAAVSLDGQVVSSTRIRKTIRAGKLEATSQMLGRPYAVCGKIVEGDRLGRKLGFPTANLETAGLCLPPNGVYAGLTRLGDRTYRVALNIGRRPTLLSPAPVFRVEAHLLDFTGDLYGRELEIEVGERLRDEKKFDTTLQLSEQISRDLQAVREKTGFPISLNR
jgi:riboflavin kinase/FMN adenylyltransferase